jgi:hypothetical protein
MAGKEELTALLPKLVGLLSMDKQQGPQMWRDALTQLFSASPCPLAPGDLLFALHQLPTPAGGGPEVCFPALCVYRGGWRRRVGAWLGTCVSGRRSVVACAVSLTA